MSPEESANRKREFFCQHCHGKIVIPYELPSTTAPCPHCGEVITSPAVPVAMVTPVIPVAEPVVREVEVVPDLPNRMDSPASPVGPQPVGNKPKEGASLLVPILVMLFLLLAAAGVWFYFSRTSFTQPPALPDPERQAKLDEEVYLKSGWRKDALSVLNGFLTADTVEKKAAFVLHGNEQLEEMKRFYGSERIDDSDTPAFAYAAFDLAESDRKRGMFMMLYDQPPMFELREFFRPLPTMEVQYGVESPDVLLSSMARASNFATEQVKVQALFMRTPQGLKIDWPTFVQTKYHLFRSFINAPRAGASGVFRVQLEEDVPDRGRSVSGERTYKVFDPADGADFAKVSVPVDSDMGRVLSEINWIGIQSSRIELRTATVELEWSSDQIPQLNLKRFICWEFLGFGGKPLPDSGK